MTADLQQEHTAEGAHRAPRADAAPHAVVEEFLTELRGALVELTEQRSADVRHQLSQAVDALRDHGRGAASGEDAARLARPARLEPGTRRRQPGPEGSAGPGVVTLAAVAAVALGWALLFWSKAGSPALAVAALVGANVTACAMLWPRRVAP